jgi:glycosyltransferase involved in cell wall biosynthesis
VICSSTSSLPEVAGDAALLVDPQDTAGLAAAIRQIVQDEGLRRDLVERGHQRVQRFSWGSCARQVLAVLEEVGGEAS